MQEIETIKKLLEKIEHQDIGESPAYNARQALTALKQLEEKLNHQCQFGRTDGYGQSYCNKCGEQENG